MASRASGRGPDLRDSTLPVLGGVGQDVANGTGVWIKDLPITPQKILKAFGANSQGEESLPPRT